MFRRIIIKISGEGLAGESSDNHFDDDAINRIVKDVLLLVSKGTEVSIVVGGGNFWRGRDAKKGMDKNKAHQIGMLATIMNGIYLCEAFRLNSQDSSKRPAVVMSTFEINAFTERFNKEKALDYMKSAIVPIFVGGTGHPFFSTDSIVAIRACELEVNAILYAKNIDSVYNENPSGNPNAKKFKDVSYQTIISKNLEVADISAINLSSNENIPSIVFALNKENAIIKASTGKEGIYEIGGTNIENNINDVFY